MIDPKLALPSSARAWLLACARMVLVFVCALGLSACAARAYDVPDSAYGGDYGGGGYDDDYASADYMEMEYDEVAAEESISLAGTTSARRARSGGARMKRRERVQGASPPGEPMAEPAEAPMDMGGEGEATENGATTEPEPDAAEPTKRQIIYTAFMRVATFDVPSALEAVQAMAEDYGGWIQGWNDDAITIRVPAERLEQAMDAVGELGVVEARNLESQDVTAEFTDLDSRIRVLESMQAHLQELLKQAKTVEQSLKIRRALDQVTMELELLRARMRNLSEAIAFSTLTVQFTERGPGTDVPTSNDPFPWVDGLGVEATEYR